MVSQQVRAALMASLASKAIAALLGLMAIPLYVKYLGLDAYGVVGFFVSVQAIVACLDFGLPATLTRALASGGAGREKPGNVHDLVRTFELAYFVLTVLACGVAITAAPWLATYWLHSKSMDAASLTMVLMLASLALASMWPSLLYGAALEGLEQQHALARLTAVLAVIRTVVTLAAVYLRPTLVTFFAVQIAMGLAQTFLSRRQMLNAMPRVVAPPRWRWAVIQDSRQFAGTMTVIGIAAIALTQLDKLILSAVLPLQEFGIYVLAATLAGGLYVLISPLFSIVYPAFSRLWATNREALPEQYQLASEVMAAMVMPLAAVLAMFPSTVLWIWTGNDLIAEAGAWPLSLLVLGCALNGVMNIPYALQLAAGWARLPLYINLVTIAWAIPSTWWAAKTYGGVGGAAVWLGLNTGFLVFTPIFMHRKLLPNAMKRWYLNAVLVPISVCAVSVWALSILHLTSLARWQLALLLIGYWLLTTLLICTSLPLLRHQLRALVAVRFARR